MTFEIASLLKEQLTVFVSTFGYHILVTKFLHYSFPLYEYCCTGHRMLRTGGVMYNVRILLLIKYLYYVGKDRFCPEACANFHHIKLSLRVIVYLSE